MDAFWQRAKETVYRSPEELAAQHARELRKGLFYDKLMRGPADTPAVALTFDDGPHPDFTPKLLALLDRYHVKATFFVVGEKAEKLPRPDPRRARGRPRGRESHLPSRQPHQDPRIRRSGSSGRPARKS